MRTARAMLSPQRFHHRLTTTHKIRNNEIAATQ
jgi:hypothetical protein